jgi:hypothetical protein
MYYTHFFWLKNAHNQPVWVFYTRNNQKDNIPLLHLFIEKSVNYIQPITVVLIEIIIVNYD